MFNDLLKNTAGKILALSLLPCLFLSSCGLHGDIGTMESFTDTSAKDDNSESAVLYPYTFEDSSGNSITLSGKPERVAVLFSSFADIWRLSGGECYVTV